MTTAAKRPTVNVFGIDGKVTKKTVVLPDVFTAPIRADVVVSVHALISLNGRQPYAVSPKAGHQTSAESWGTGRAVARIPRVRGGGTHRSGQAAYGNMCRGGRMFAPTKIWRKWHHRVPVKQRQYALAAAVAATAVPALVEARGHMIENMPEIPMVVSNEIEGLTKTKEAVALLKKVHAHEDVEKAIASKRMRGTKGKMRNRRFKMKRGPLVIYKNDNGITRAFRNVPSVSLMSTTHMNLLKLAPGGHVGRLVIWSQDAFEEMNKYFGDYNSGQTKLPVNKMQISDIRAIIRNITAKGGVRRPQFCNKKAVVKRNPLKHKAVMLKLNPAWGKLTKPRVAKKFNAKTRCKAGTPYAAYLDALKRRKEAKLGSKTEGEKQAAPVAVKATGKAAKK